MGASFTVKFDFLKRLSKSFQPDIVKNIFKDVAQEKAVAGIIGQAIADNFDQQGPGWAPLSPATIRNSVAAHIKKNLSGVSDSDLLEYEEKARKSNGSIIPHRTILVRTGVLKKSASMPYAPGNIYQVSGTNIVWGTNLSYASIHNRGGSVKFPGTDNGFGRGVKIKAHDIPVPKREFLKLSDKWKKDLNEYVASRAIFRLKQMIRSAGK